ncbi:ATP-binding protein [Candidatus Micrarchaeota archaeon]|nr:ATP-binding protein [Candidatus Micrarchaeota archaeon]
MDDAELLKLLYTFNPWWEGKTVSVPEKKRRDYYVLLKALEDKQITAILGPRRVGKSVLMQQLITQLLEEKVNPKSILFVRLDEPRFDQEKGLLINRLLEVYLKYVLESELGSYPKKIYILLDEIQHVEKWNETLKSYYDRGYKIKFVVSGSSAAGITKGSSESLAGRISIHLVMPLKFIDYLKFKGINGNIENVSFRLRESLKSAIEKGNASDFVKGLNNNLSNAVQKQAQIERLLSEYMIKGGYIELIENKDYAWCAKYLQDLMQLVIYKDIVKVFGIRNPKAMEDLLLFLGNHSSELFSETSASSKLNMKQETVGEYLDYLEEVFLARRSAIYSKNRSKQLRNPKKVYICDTGIRNVLNGTYSRSALRDSKDVGLMAETVAHDHLVRLAFHLNSYDPKCYYWKNGKEIDNVIVHGKKAIPIEVKYKNDIVSEDSKCCSEFIVRNDSPFGIVITKDKFSHKDKIIFVPFWYFLLLC